VHSLLSDVLPSVHCNVDAPTEDGPQAGVRCNYTNRSQVL